MGRHRPPARPAEAALKRLAALTALAILFSGSAEAVTGISAVGYADEILTVLFVVGAFVSRLMAKTRIRRIPGTLPVTLFTLAGVLSGLIHSVPLPLTGTSAFVMLKGWLFAVALAQLTWTREDVQRAARFGGVVLAVAIAGAAANLILGQRWVDLWHGTAYYSFRYGLPSLQGLFSAPLAAGNVMACAALAVITHGWVFGMTWKHRLLTVGASLGTLMTGRRTAALGAVVGGVVAGLRQKAASTTAQLLVLAPIVVVAAWNVIIEATSTAVNDYVVNSETTARSLMYRDMFDVANGYFPLGAGLGRFGSYMAGAEYSPEYISRGYDGVWGLSVSTGNATFLTDTQWPAVLGETGYIGALFALLALAALAVQFVRSSRAADLTERWLGLAGGAVFIVVAVASIGLPIFFGSTPPQAPFYGIVGILIGYRASQTVAAPPANPRGAALSALPRGL